jgi:AcrR family transcriptional regulator
MVSTLGGTGADLAKVRAVTERLPQYARSDARDNRHRILTATRSAVAAGGVRVSMREVAGRAGVAAATVYRHFPTKQILVTAAFTERMAACGALLERGLADPDPWRGFRTAVEEISVLHALDQDFSTAFLAAYPRAVDVAPERERGLTAFTRLARRAQRAGALRADLVPDDLVLLLMANRGVRAASPTATAAAARRLAALLLQSLHTAADPLPPPVPLSFPDRPPGP